MATKRKATRTVCHREGSEIVIGAATGGGSDEDGSETSRSIRGRAGGEEGERGGRGAKLVLSP